MYDWLVVGAGFTGSVMAERLASQLGQRVAVIDRRWHVGGNANDYMNPAGILVHRYGPHIFHTNSEEVFSYLSRFTEWVPYEHKVLASIDGQLVPLPFNLNSIDALFPKQQAGRYCDALVNEFGTGKSIPILKLRESTDRKLRALADYIYDKVFKNYTAKQWGLRLEDLATSVSARVPVYVGRDDRYFKDTYQAMPKVGFTSLFEKMLDHPNIDLLLGTDLREAEQSIAFNRVFYTGPIDEFFDYMYGPLPYRSLDFEFEDLDCPMFQPATVVNYPNDHAFTRITEFKHFQPVTTDKTVIVREYPCDYEAGVNDAYYPIVNDETQLVYKRYAAQTKKIQTNAFMAGRLADYRYYNMDQAVARALMIFKKLAHADTPRVVGES